MRQFRFLFLILSGSVISSCNTTVKSDFSFYPYFEDTSSNKKQFIKVRKKEYDYFNLSDITNGTTDSLEIRIWPNHAFDITKNLFVFHLKGHEFSGFHYNSFMMPITESDGITYTKTDLTGLGDSVFIVKEIIPKCGWKKFQDSVNYFRIQELPTQFDIKNFQYSPTLDGYGYSFEFATKGSYRFISYGNPKLYKYTECKLVHGFISMLERQFGEDFNWPLNLKVPPKN